MTGTMAALGDHSWVRTHAPDLEGVSAAEWNALDAQRALWLRDVRPRALLTLFHAAASDPSFGYETNMYDHCLRAGTRALKDGLPDETVAAILLHDVGYALNPASHGEVAALVLAPYVSEANEWMLRHHQIFIDHHAPHHAAADPAGRERFRGHPHFEWTARFCERYDQATIRAGDEALPFAAFEPVLQRVFAAPPREVRK